jgi:hypothetical protein
VILPGKEKTGFEKNAKCKKMMTKLGKTKAKVRDKKKKIVHNLEGRSMLPGRRCESNQMVPKIGFGHLFEYPLW